MTSPTRPTRVPLTERISERISRRRASPYGDPEERFQRNVTIGFVAVIVIAAVIIVVGLLYGFYESNLKPMATVGGTQIGRGAWEERLDLVAFRIERAEQQVRSQLAQGTIDEDLASRRLSRISAQGQVAPSSVMEELVDLTFQAQLAEDRGISVGEEELDAALAADGASPEARRVSALIITSDEQAAGLPPSSQGQAEAEARAEEARAQIESGSTIAELADEYSPFTAETDGDLGYRERDDLGDAYFADVIFSLEEGEVSDVIEGASGELIIAQVTDIVPPQMDAGFGSAVTDVLSEDAYRRNVELETVASKLEEQVVAEQTAGDVPQVQLAEILIAGDPATDPSTDEGQVHASHILYAPNDDPNATPPDDPEATPPTDDPAWEEARQQAEAAASELRAIADVEARVEAFDQRAEEESDDQSAAAGGDLGFFSRGAMVPEFADPLFDDESLERGDIVGPVRSQFGWHVIMFEERRAPIAERLAAAQEALAAEGSDFAAVAREHSDGPEALDGGETGWHVVEELDPLSAITIQALLVGEVSEPVEGEDGYVIYKKLDEAERPLDEPAAARIADTAFLDWYDEVKFEAEAEGRISIDQAVYDAETLAAAGSRA